MRLLVSYPSWNPVFGGAYFSLSKLTETLSRLEHTVTLFTADYPHGRVMESPKGIAMAVARGRLIPVLGQTLTPGAQGRLEQLVRSLRPSVVHDNGLWLSLNHAVAAVSSRHQVPRLVSPRGTLDPWAMEHKSWKKRIAMALYQRRDLEGVACFHATSVLEAEHIRRMGLRQPIAIIPNGVEVPAETATFEGNNPRQVLYLGRLNPIKNLPNLLRAWAAVRPMGWRLLLAGSDEAGHKALLVRLAGELGISDEVRFLDPLYDEEEKRNLIRSAQLLALVSFSENFGLAVAEALANGVPVLASRNTPWASLEVHRAGWWVEGSAAGIAEGLKAVFDTSPEVLRDMGQRGRMLVQNQFDWPSIAKQFEATYQWVSGEGTKPACIVD